MKNRIKTILTSQITTTLLSCTLAVILGVLIIRGTKAPEPSKPVETAQTEETEENPLNDEEVNSLMGSSMESLILGSYRVRGNEEKSFTFAEENRFSGYLSSDNPDTKDGTYSATYQDGVTLLSISDSVVTISYEATFDEEGNLVLTNPDTKKSYTLLKTE